MSSNRGQRGAALIAVLFVLLLCELAILMVTTEINHLARRITLDRDRTAAARLAESGLEHAYAVLGASPAPPARLAGNLAEGRYEVAIRMVAPGRVALVSSGRAISGRRVTIRLVGRLESGAVRPVARTFAHELGD